MKAKTAKDVLIAAHWILTHYGWCQGESYKDVDGNPFSFLSERSSEKLGSCCLGAALCLVEVDHSSVTFNVYDEAYDEAYDMITSVLKVPNIPYWNDQQGRTKKEVLTLLDKLIAKV
jgi:hypothetical protein